MDQPKITERVVRNRVVRLSLATVLIAISIWAFVPYLGSRVSSSAFVNTELVRVTSPIAGRLTQQLPRRGDFIATSHAVDLVKALAPDQRHLLDLREQYEVAKRRAMLARAQLNEIRTSDRTLGQRASAYQEGMISRVFHEIEEAKIESKGCLAEEQKRRDIGSRYQALVKQGTASQIRSSEALATQQATTTRCELAKARVKRLSDELASARRGTFVRDGANDVPYSQQQRDRLLFRRQELQTDLLNQSMKVEQLAVALKEEKARLDHTNHFQLTLPAGYVVWSTAASPGSAVIAGQSIMDLADCRRRFVAVELPEREFEQINDGDRAAVRLLGSNNWVYGSVRQERGSAAHIDERMLAARVVKPSSGSITVEVDLPADVWPEDRSRNFCDIGRLAEVRFPRAGGGLSGLISHMFSRTVTASR